MIKKIFFAVALVVLAGCETKYPQSSPYAEYGFSFDPALSPVSGLSPEAVRQAILTPTPEPLVVAAPRNYLEPEEGTVLFSEGVPVPQPPRTNLAQQIIYVPVAPVARQTPARAPAASSGPGAVPQPGAPWPQPYQPFQEPAGASAAASSFGADTGQIITNNPNVSPTNQLPPLLSPQAQAQTNPPFVRPDFPPPGEPAGTELATNSPFGGLGSRVTTNPPGFGPGTPAPAAPNGSPFAPAIIPGAPQSGPQRPQNPNTTIQPTQPVQPSQPAVVPTPQRPVQPMRPVAPQRQLLTPTRP